MTTATGVCAHCGAASLIAELRVYARGPGTVARCGTCGNVVMVLVEAGSTLRVDLAGFQMSREPSGPASTP
jgi:hypothetical protein